jgi:transcriptional regulator with XRE-family HTH domain
MIRTDSEYQEVRRRIESEKLQIAEQLKLLGSMSLTQEQIAATMEPLLAYHQRHLDEIEHYDYLKAGNLPEIHDLQDLGRLLIELRVCRGLTQVELAQRLCVSSSQVSRDERNEYHGISKERAAAIIRAMLQDKPAVSGLHIAFQLKVDEHPKLLGKIIDFSSLERTVLKQRQSVVSALFPYINLGHEEFSG